MTKITLEQDNKDPIVLETNSYIVITDDKEYYSGGYSWLLGVIEYIKSRIIKQINNDERAI